MEDTRWSPGSISRLEKPTSPGSRAVFVVSEPGWTITLSSCGRFWHCHHGGRVTHTCYNRKARDSLCEASSTP